MTMKIRVEVNGREVAAATITNLSDLAETSNYMAIWSEQASDQTGLPERANLMHINGHLRRQSIWALVEKVAARAAQGADILGSTK